MRTEAQLSLPTPSCTVFPMAVVVRDKLMDAMRAQLDNQLFGSEIKKAACKPGRIDSDLLELGRGWLSAW